MPVRLDSDDGIAVVTIDREEALNALDVETLEALRAVLAEVAAAVAVRVVVLTGAGEKAFAAGADIKYMSGLEVDGALVWGALGHEVGRLLEPRSTGSRSAAGVSSRWRATSATARRGRSSGSPRSIWASCPAGVARNASSTQSARVTRRN
jgi:enoyl-CoA hydratase/carnithine racemase